MLSCRRPLSISQSFTLHLLSTLHGRGAYLRAENECAPAFHGELNEIAFWNHTYPASNRCHAFCFFCLAVDRMRGQLPPRCEYNPE